MSPPANTPAHARLFFADALRVVAAFLVVTAHVALGLLYYSSPEHPLSWFDWHFALAINSSARWIVAGFVMVSGAFILNPARDEPTALFYKKSLSRIGIPLLFWSAFYTAWPYLFAAANYNNAALRHLRGLTGLALPPLLRRARAQLAPARSGSTSAAAKCAASSTSVRGRTCS